MTFAEYLADLRKRNPDMPLTGKMTISIESFEIQLRRAFSAGENNGMTIKSKASDLLDKIAPWMKD